MLFYFLAGSRETQQISQSAWSAVTPHHHTATTDRYSRTDRYQNPDSQRSLRQPQDQPQNPRDRYATAAGTPENERSLIQVRQNLVFHKVEKIQEDSLDSIPSPLPTVGENSNYWRESLLEVIRQNNAG